MKYNQVDEVELYYLICNKRCFVKNTSLYTVCLYIELGGTRKASGDVGRKRKGREARKGKG